MTPRQQIKSLLVTSDPITAGLRQEADAVIDMGWNYQYYQP